MIGLLMTRRSELIDDKVFRDAQEMLTGMGNNAKGIIKLKAIVAAKEHGITQVAKIFNVSRNSITAWIKKLKDSPESILHIGLGRGRKNTLNNTQLEVVKSWLSENPNITIKYLIANIYKHFGIELKKTAVHQIIKKLSFSYVTARPKHFKQDNSKHDEFKKKSGSRGKK
jgi:transposase